SRRFHIHAVAAAFSPLFICLSLSNCSPRKSAETGHTPVVRMSSISISSNTEIQAAGQVSHVLKVVPHLGEEPAVGPDSFAVLDDGSVLISDPAQNRRAQFSIVDSHAVFESQAPLPGGDRIVAASAYDQDVRDKARLVNESTATIHRFFSDDSSSDLDVSFDDRQKRLVSIVSLGTDEMGYTYVVLETAARSPVVDVQRLIRKYNRRSVIVAQISDVPRQQEVSPQPEFRVKNGIVYQMVVSTDGVLINRWDTRQNQ
ncbi:MAG: hypothetical protein ABR880_25050, partial [Candidatus Sulfotelmatobacter sp.]